MESRSEGPDNPKIDYEEDAHLVQECLDGDPRAWDKLVARYSRLIYSIALRRGFSQEDAADVHQSVFAILVRKLGSLRNHRCLAAWLITTTQRECRQVAKSFAMTVELTEFNDVTTLADEVEIWERQHLVREALAQLDPPSRQLLTALFLEADSSKYADVAKRLDLPVGSIGPMRARAFKRLEAVLRSMDYDGKD